MKQIVRPTKTDDGNCRVCESENPIITVQGSVVCYYCGMEVNLCADCLKRMIKELYETINLLGMKELQRLIKDDLV